VKRALKVLSLVGITTEPSCAHGADLALQRLQQGQDVALSPAGSLVHSICRRRASARIALIAWNSPSATTARKLPSCTTAFTPGMVLMAGGIDRDQLRARARRAHDPCMQHALGPQVLQKGDAAGEPWAGMSTRGKRPAHDLEVAEDFSARIRLRLDMQVDGGGELAIAERSDLLVGRLQSPRRHVLPPCGLGDQQRAHLRRRVADRSPAVLHRLAAGGEASLGVRPVSAVINVISAGCHLKLLGGDLERQRLS